MKLGMNMQLSPITIQDNSVNVTASDTTGKLYGFTNEVVNI